MRGIHIRQSKVNSSSKKKQAVFALTFANFQGKFFCHFNEVFIEKILFLAIIIGKGGVYLEYCFNYKFKTTTLLIK